MSNTKTEMSLSDEVIGQVARLVQIAILTGTDVVDNLRMLRVTFDEEDELIIEKKKKTPKIKLSTFFVSGRGLNVILY